MSSFKGVLEFQDIGTGVWILKLAEQVFQLDASKIPADVKSGDTITVEGDEEEVMSIGMVSDKRLVISSIVKSE